MRVGERPDSLDNASMIGVSLPNRPIPPTADSVRSAHNRSVGGGGAGAGASAAAPKNGPVQEPGVLWGRPRSASGGIHARAGRRAGGAGGGEEGTVGYRSFYDRSRPHTHALSFAEGARALADRLRPVVKTSGQLTKRGIKKLAVGVEKGIAATSEAAAAVRERATHGEKEEGVLHRQDAKKRKGKEEISEWVALEELNQTGEDAVEAEGKALPYLKEVMVFRSNGVVHIYDVCEIGECLSFLLGVRFALC